MLYHTRGVYTVSINCLKGSAKTAAANELDDAIAVSEQELGAATLAKLIVIRIKAIATLGIKAVDHTWEGFR